MPDAVVSVLRKYNRTGAMMSDAERKAVWTTAITKIEPNKVAVRGYDIADLMGKASFGAAVYLILKGELPDERVGKLMDAILVASIDHGATPPSALAARTVASTGASLSASVAAGNRETALTLPELGSESTFEYVFGEGAFEYVFGEGGVTGYDGENGS